MLMGERLRALREQKKLSQGDIESRTGLLRCYISRVENGHTVPAVETLEKLARAFEVPLYQLFYDGEAPPAERKKLALLNGQGNDDVLAREDRVALRRIARALPAMNERDRALLVNMATAFSKRVLKRRRKE
jgi:transcriptional regulator with XRE-family HTH domain